MKVWIAHQIHLVFRDKQDAINAAIEAVAGHPGFPKGKEADIQVILDDGNPYVFYDYAKYVIDIVESELR